MAAKKKFAEFDLPPVLVQAFSGAVGASRIAACSSSTRTRIMQLANRTAGELGQLLEDDELQRSDDPSD